MVINRPHRGLTLKNSSPKLVRMRSENEHKDPRLNSEQRELLLLSELDIDPSITQRKLSNKVGMALGLTNVLLRNLAEKGYVRVTRAGWRNWLYNLTPEGVSHKIGLTVAYVNRVLDQYHRVRVLLSKELEGVSFNEESRVAIYADNELGELVYLGLREIGIEEIDVFMPGAPADRKFLGKAIKDITTLNHQDYDRVVIAVLGDSQGVLGELEDLGVPADAVVVLFGDRRAREGK